MMKQQLQHGMLKHCCALWKPAKHGLALWAMVMVLSWLVQPVMAQKRMRPLEFSFTLGGSDHSQLHDFDKYAAEMDKKFAWKVAPDGAELNSYSAFGNELLAMFSVGYRITPKVTLGLEYAFGYARQTTEYMYFKPMAVVVLLPIAIISPKTIAEKYEAIEKHAHFQMLTPTFKYIWWEPKNQFWRFYSGLNLGVAKADYSMQYEFIEYDENTMETNETTPKPTADDTPRMREQSASRGEIDRQTVGNDNRRTEWSVAWRLTVLGVEFGRAPIRVFSEFGFQRKAYFSLGAKLAF